MSTAKRFLILMAAASLGLAACAQNNPDTPIASAQVPPPVDDDTYCQANGGPPGTSAYVACRKDRDVGATRGSSRMERAHKNLAEDMLNNRR